MDFGHGLESSWAYNHARRLYGLLDGEIPDVPNQDKNQRHEWANRKDQNEPLPDAEGTSVSVPSRHTVRSRLSFRQQKNRLANTRAQSQPP